MEIPPIIEVGGVLVSGDIIERKFCCDLEACRGACCVEGDAGAPVTLEEIASIEERLDDVWKYMCASAQSVVDRKGVAYADPEGELVTSIVNGRDCVFTCVAGAGEGLPEGCCICALEKLAREKGAVGKGERKRSRDKTVVGDGDGLGGEERMVDGTGLMGEVAVGNGDGLGGEEGADGEGFVKPISCALYPIREKNIGGTVCLNYHRWGICGAAEKKGERLGLRVYRFLRGPLIRRFGREWYEELVEVAEALLGEE